MSARTCPHEHVSHAKPPAGPPPAPDRRAPVRPRAPPRAPPCRRVRPRPGAPGAHERRTSSLDVTLPAESVKPARRTTLAVLGSLALHVSPLVRGGCGFDVEFDMPELEFELTELEPVVLDAQIDQKPPESPQPEPEVIPPPMGPEKPPEGEGPKPAEEEKPPPPKPKFGEKSSKVAELGPASSTAFVFLNAKKVAGLPFADTVVEIMAPQIDFDFIVTGGGFHPLKDFNYLVLASSNIRDYTQTFIAVEYKLAQEEMIAGLNRAAESDGQSIVWEVRDGRMMGNPKPLKDPDKDTDPRWFVFLEDNVGVYVREEFLPSIIAGPDESKGNTVGNYVANLSKLRTFAAREPRAGLQIVVKDISSTVKFRKEPPFPLPDRLELMAEASSSPELVIKGEFLDAVDATKAQNLWADDLAKLIDDKVPFYARFMVRSFYEQTEFTRDDKNVQLRSDFSKEQAKFILEQIAEGARRMLKKTPEQIEADRKRREEMWAARKNGKLTPSEALQQQKQQAGGSGAAQPPGTSGTPKPAPGGTGAPKPLPTPPAGAPTPPVEAPPPATPPV
jgi:hypothetical protein